ncbi:hypothetical protein BPO_0593 [Bergeyella porcorum]|uniref:Uncharacterized protein n=1 Tax=Bergeyella porcorum TaxID=1735111 RepID=A0AAU0EZR8_9FLAO
MEWIDGFLKRFYKSWVGLALFRAENGIIA